jgi:hypothetical protein
MNLSGWITMLVSLGFVWSLTFWCFRRVLSSPTEEKAPVGLGP